MSSSQVLNYVREACIDEGDLSVHTDMGDLSLDLSITVDAAIQVCEKLVTEGKLAWFIRPTDDTDESATVYPLNGRIVFE